MSLLKMRAELNTVDPGQLAASPQNQPCDWWVLFRFCPPYFAEKLGKCVSARPDPISPQQGEEGFSYSLNVPAHRERPQRGLSALAESQRGRDAVARFVYARHGREGGGASPLEEVHLHESQDT